MDILSYGSLQLLRNAAIYPEMRKLRIYLDENKTAMSNYYNQTNYFIKNNHPLMILFTRLYEFFGDTPEQTYYNVMFNITSIASATRFTNLNSNQHPVSAFSGIDTIVMDDTAFKTPIPVESWIGGKLLDWETYKGIKLTYHEESDFTPTLFIDTLSTAANKSIVYLDLPLLAAQFHHFTINGQRAEVAPGVNDFLVQYLYIPLYEDVMNWSFFNRLQYLVAFNGNKLNLSPNENVRKKPSYFFFDIDYMVDELILKVGNTLKRLGTWDLGKVLSNIPLPYADNAKALLPPLSSYYTDPIQWVEMLTQMLLYKQYRNLAKLLLVEVNYDKYTRTIPLKLTESRIRNLTNNVDVILLDWVQTTLKVDRVD